MTEHKRVVNEYSKEVHQWVDAERCMVIDSVTGKPERFGTFHNSIGTFDDALEYVSKRSGWEERMIIIKMNCVVAYKV